jgi:hypothetical protein
MVHKSSDGLHAAIILCHADVGKSSSNSLVIKKNQQLMLTVELSKLAVCNLFSVLWCVFRCRNVLVADAQVEKLTLAYIVCWSIRPYAVDYRAEIVRLWRNASWREHVRLDWKHM